MEEQSVINLETIQRQLRQGKPALLANDALLGAWMPARMDGRLMESAFVYSGKPDREGQVKRPYAWLTVDSATGRIVRYVYCALEDFIDTRRYPLETKVCLAGNQPSPRRSAEGKAFWEAYQAIRSFALMTPSDLSGEQRSAVQKLEAAMAEALLPALLPYYHALAPDFFQWVADCKR